MRVQNDPHFLLYGYTKRMPYDVPNSTLIKCRTSAGEMDEVTEEIYHRIKRIRELSQELLEKEVKKYTRNQDKKDKDRKIEIGNLVCMQAVKPRHLSPKLYRQWRGPFRMEGVARKLGKGNVYILRDRNTNRLHNCHCYNFRVVKLRASIPQMDDESEGRRGKIRNKLQEKNPQQLDEEIAEDEDVMGYLVTRRNREDANEGIVDSNTHFEIGQKDDVEIDETPSPEYNTGERITSRQTEQEPSERGPTEKKTPPQTRQLRSRTLDKSYRPAQG